MDDQKKIAFSLPFFKSGKLNAAGMPVQTGIICVVPEKLSLGLGAVSQFGDNEVTITFEGHSPLKFRADGVIAIISPESSKLSKEAEKLLAVKGDEFFDLANDLIIGKLPEGFGKDAEIKEVPKSTKTFGVPVPNADLSKFGGNGLTSTEMLTGMQHGCWYFNRTAYPSRTAKELGIADVKLGGLKGRQRPEITVCHWTANINGQSVEFRVNFSRDADGSLYIYGEGAWMSHGIQAFFLRLTAAHVAADLINIPSDKFIMVDEPTQDAAEKLRKLRREA